MLLNDFLNLDHGLIGTLEWIIIYMIHSTLFFILVKWIVSVKVLSINNVSKELLWRGALFGSLLTATFQFSSGFNVIRLPQVSQGIEFKKELVYRGENVGMSLDTEPLTSYRSIPEIQDPIQKKAAGAASPAIELPATQMAWAAILLISVAGIIMLLYQAFIYYRYIRTLRPLTPVDKQIFLEHIKELTSKANYSPDIKLKSSKKLNSPVAIGTNSIFIPEKSLDILSGEQIRSMLAHELAHLLRRDTLWNWAYLLTETLLFFQPLNKQIRRELQENAELVCDEWAVALTGNKKAMASCLVEVAGWHAYTSSNAIVPGMALHHRSLHHRINNILTYKNMENKKHQAPFAAFVMILIGFLAIVITPGTSNAQQENKTVPEKSTPEYPAKDTLPQLDPDPAEEAELDFDLTPDLEQEMEAGMPPIPSHPDFPEHPEFDPFSKEYDFSYQFNSDDFNINFNGDSIFKHFEKLFEADFGRHFDKNFSFSFSFQDDSTRVSSRFFNNDRKVVIENGEIKELWIDGKRVPDEEIKNHNIVIEDFKPDFRRREFSEMRNKEVEFSEREALKRREMAELRREEANVRREEANVRRDEANVRREEANSKRKEAAERREKAQKFNNLLEETLLKDKLIKDPHSYSLQLNHKELKINDIKQSDKVFKKYKKLFESQTGTSLDEKTNFLIRKNR